MNGTTTSTIAQDFYDLISYRRYGSEYYMDKLIDANPDNHLTVRFDAGVRLNTPQVDPIPIAGLAPWRRVLKLR